MKANKEQIAASKASGGVTLVIAGAGTGKTTTMIEKITNCINSGIASPENILIMTFSKKAAVEIKERVLHKIDSGASIGFTGTFHSFALHLLKNYYEDYIKLKGINIFPSIIEDEEKLKIMQEIISDKKEKLLGIPVDAVIHIAENFHKLNSYLISKLKSSALYQEFANIISEYKEYKIQNNLIDFEDMINDAILLLQSKPDIRSNVLSKFNYLFVDEFQDTSINNFLLINLLTPDTKKNLFMVGDDYQSIYKFRDARVEYLINIKKYFHDAEIYKLTTNYRSRHEIVDLANKFIKLNKFRTKKTINSKKGKGGMVKFYSANDASHEAEIICQIIEGYRNKEAICVLYRNNFQGDIISQKLKRADILDVNLMTMHASKGLEFDVVIIAGVCDKIIPDKNSDIEEERRLFYVALTRAKEHLHIVYYKNLKRLPRFIWELKKGDV